MLKNKNEKTFTRLSKETCIIAVRNFVLVFYRAQRFSSIKQIEFLGIILGSKIDSNSQITTQPGTVCTDQPSNLYIDSHDLLSLSKVRSSQRFLLKSKHLPHLTAQLTHV